VRTGRRAFLPVTVREFAEAKFIVGQAAAIRESETSVGYGDSDRIVEEVIRSSFGRLALSLARGGTRSH